MKFHVDKWRKYATNIFYTVYIDDFLCDLKRLSIKFNISIQDIETIVKKYNGTLVNVSINEFGVMTEIIHIVFDYKDNAKKFKEWLEALYISVKLC